MSDGKNIRNALAETPHALGKPGRGRLARTRRVQAALQALVDRREEALEQASKLRSEYQDAHDADERRPNISVKVRDLVHRVANPSEFALGAALGLALFVPTANGLDNFDRIIRWVMTFAVGGGFVAATNSAGVGIAAWAAYRARDQLDAERHVSLCRTILVNGERVKNPLRNASVRAWSLSLLVALSLLAALAYVSGYGRESYFATASNQLSPYVLGAAGIIVALAFALVEFAWFQRPIAAEDQRLLAEERNARRSVRRVEMVAAYYEQKAHDLLASTSLRVDYHLATESTKEIRRISVGDDFGFDLIDPKTGQPPTAVGETSTDTSRMEPPTKPFSGQANQTNGFKPFKDDRDDAGKP